MTSVKTNVSYDGGAGRLMREAAKVSYGSTSVSARRQRAYQWYMRLGLPPYRVFQRMVRETKGMDIKEPDIDLLPWNVKTGKMDKKAYEDMVKEDAENAKLAKEGKKLDRTELNASAHSRRSGRAPRRRSLLQGQHRNSFEEEMNRAAEEHHREEEEQRRKHEEDERKAKLAKEQAEKEHADEERRKQEQILADLRERENALRLREEEVRRREQRVRAKEQQLNEREKALDQREKELARREAEFKKRTDDLKRKQQEEDERKQHEEEEHRHALERALRWYNKLIQPTRDQMHRVADLLPSSDDIVEKYFTEADVELLPWDSDGKEVRQDKLMELCQKYGVDPQGKAVRRSRVRPFFQKEDSLPQDAWFAAGQHEHAEKAGEDEDFRKMEAYRWYKNLSKPKLKTYQAVINETKGQIVPKNPTSQDVEDLLPWDPTKTYVDESKMDEWMKHVKEAKKAAKAKRRSSFKGTGNVDDVPAFLKLRREKRFAELQAAKAAGKYTEWEESQILKAYNWYSRLTRPNKALLKKSISHMEKCDITPEDVDLLPWIIHDRMVDEMALNRLTVRRFTEKRH